MAVASRIVRLLRDRRGVTAVETGIMLIPFLILVLTIFEVFVTMVTSQFLQLGTQSAAQEIAVSGTISDAIVRSAVCTGQMPLYSQASCMDNLRVGIVAVTGGAAPPAALTPDNELNAAAFTVSGTASDILLIRTALRTSGSRFPQSQALGQWLVAGAITRVSPFGRAGSASK